MISSVGISYGQEHEVDPLSSANAYHLIRTNKECVIVCLHNHPSNSIISLPDILYLLMYDNIKMIVAITNLGSINYIVKAKNYNKKKAFILLNEATELSHKAKKLKEYQNAVMYFLKKCKTVGVVFKYK